MSPLSASRSRRIVAVAALCLMSAAGGTPLMAGAAAQVAPGQVIASISVPANPQDAVFSADGTHVFVTSLEVGTVVAINVATMQVDDTASLGHNAGAIVRLGDDRLLVASDPSGGVDLVDTTPLAAQPWLYAPSPIAMASVPGDQISLAVDGFGGKLSILSLTRDAYWQVSVGAKPWGVAASPDGATAYVAVQSNNSVAVVDLGGDDPASARVTASIPVGARPAYVTVSGDGSRLYVAEADSGNVTAIDTSSQSVVATYSIGGKPWGIAVSPDGGYVYVVDNSNGTLTSIDTSTGASLATVATGTNPDFVATSPDGTMVAVVNSGSNTVSLVQGYSTAPVAEVGGDGESAPSDVAQSSPGLPVVIILLLAVGGLVVVGIVIVVVLVVRAGARGGAVAPVVSVTGGGDPANDLRMRAADPATPRTTLAEIAYAEPSLRAVIAANPSTYEALLEWLGQFDDPEVIAALRQRRAT